MKRNRAAVVTTVSTVMLGAGWAAGIVAAGVGAGADGTSVAALGSTSGVGSTTTSSDASGATSGTVPNTPTPSSTPAANTSTGVSGTFDGALVKTREGNFQAEIVVDGGAITAVNVLVGGDNRRDSVQINERALPTLQERVLSAQSWNVEGISGASYTVQGFLTSVKEAMTQAGIA